MPAARSIRRLSLLVLGLCLALALNVLAAHHAAAATTTYSATQTIPVPPAAAYAGSGGGDGWAVALSSASVYNVFHHAGDLTVACHRQADATACWSPRTITDADGNAFATAAHPGLWLSPTTGRLYVYVTRSSDLTGGVACIDTAAAETASNPFCGFTALTGQGESSMGSGFSDLSDPSVVGQRWYAFNYAEADHTGSRARVLCFDLVAGSACAGQPYAVALGSADLHAGTYPAPSVATIGGKVVVPAETVAGEVITCFDPSTGTTCAGSWPIHPAADLATSVGAPFPLLDGTGGVKGFCLPSGGADCWSLSGEPLTPPANVGQVIDASSGWNGPAVVIGPRVYVPNGNTEAVDCYDFATSASCANFPKVFANLELLYTVNIDPQRPTCLWVNADGGSSQIQNFDAYTGGPCGKGPLRVLASSFVVDTNTCRPATYTSLQVLNPARSSYGSGTVAFEDADATTITGTTPRSIDGSGSVSLSGLDLSTAFGLPQFLVTLTDPVGTPDAVTVKLTWTGTDDPSCVKGGTTTGPAGGSYVAMGDSYSAGEGNSPYMPGTDNRVNSCHRSSKAYGPQLSVLYHAHPPAPTFVACSGAITDDLFNRNREANLTLNPATGRYVIEPAQLDALSSSTTLVTLTIGGNDVGFAEVLNACLGNPATGDPHCQNTGLAKSVSNRIDALAGNGKGKTAAGFAIHSYVDVLKSIRGRAKNATIRIVGYPVLVDPDDGYTYLPGRGTFCSVGALAWFGHSTGYNVVIYQDEAKWMAAQVTRLNKTIRDAVRSSGVGSTSYVDIEAPFDGHALCDADPWLFRVSGFINANGTYKAASPRSFHPTATGQLAVEAAVARSLA